MTVPTHATAAEVPAPMPRTAEPGQAAAVEGQAVAATDTNVGRRALRQVGENPLLVLFGTALIALLIFNLGATHDRITRLEERMDARFAQMDARFAALEKEVAEINRKLTAIIAALNMADEINAALEGRLILGTPSPSGDPAEATPG